MAFSHSVCSGVFSQCYPWTSHSPSAGREVVHDNAHFGNHCTVQYPYCWSTTNFDFHQHQKEVRFKKKQTFKTLLINKHLETTRPVTTNNMNQTYERLKWHGWHPGVTSAACPLPDRPGLWVSTDGGHWRRSGRGCSMPPKDRSPAEKWVDTTGRSENGYIM